MTSATVVLIEVQTPAAPSTDHTTATATTVTMPKAIESRNAVFMIDHGSTCTSRSRARLVPRARGTGLPARLADEVRARPAGARPAERDGAAPLAVPASGSLDVEPEPRDDDGVAACWMALPVAVTAADTRSESGRLAVSPFEPGSDDGPERDRRGASGYSSARRSAIRPPRSRRRHPDRS